MEAARGLIPLVTGDGARAELRELWGPTGPQTQMELNELLTAYLEAGRAPPRDDTERAFRSLMREPLPIDRPPPTHIGLTLGRLPLEDRRRLELEAWEVCVETLRGEPPLEEWSRRALAALRADQATIPDDRWRELLDCVAVALFVRRRDATFPRAMHLFVRLGEYDDLCARMGEELRDVLRRARDPIAYAASEFGSCQRRPELKLTELMLPPGFEKLSQRDVEDVWHVLSAGSSTRADEWEAWTRRHPRRTARDKVGRVFGRLGARKGGEP
jgi:hypothetical protein